MSVVGIIKKFTGTGGEKCRCVAGACQRGLVGRQLDAAGYRRGLVLNSAIDALLQSAQPFVPAMTGCH